MERIKIDRAPGHRRVADGVRLAAAGPFRRSCSVWSADLRQVAHREGARRGHAQPRHHAGLIDAGGCVRGDADRNLFGTALPSAPSIGLAVILGVEKRSSPTSSTFSPVIATSTCVPSLSAHRHDGEQARRGQADLLREGSGEQSQQADERRWRVSRSCVSGCREILSC